MSFRGRASIYRSLGATLTTSGGLPAKDSHSLSLIEGMHISRDGEMIRRMDRIALYIEECSCRKRSDNQFCRDFSECQDVMFSCNVTVRLVGLPEYGSVIMPMFHSHKAGRRSQCFCAFISTSNLHLALFRLSKCRSSNLQTVARSEHPLLEETLNDPETALVAFLI